MPKWKPWSSSLWTLDTRMLPPAPRSRYKSPQDADPRLRPKKYDVTVTDGMDFPGFFFSSSSLLAGMGVGGAGSWPDAVASQNRFAFFFPSPLPLVKSHLEDLRVRWRSLKGFKKIQNVLIFTRNVDTNSAEVKNGENLPKLVFGPVIYLLQRPHMQTVVVHGGLWLLDWNRRPFSAVLALVHDPSPHS